MLPVWKTGAAALIAAGLALAAPAAAEVTSTTGNSFVSRHEVTVKATPKEVWLALISPSEWWTSEHTWSGDSKNLTLMPKAGGCFCETIPEVDEPGRFTLEGSVEHMRVVQAYPESALRMVGALGPLQSEPVNGVLTIAISTTPKGTRIVWEYNVGAAMRYEVPVISKAVDGVMGAQIMALAKPLGVVEVAPSAAPAAAPSSPPQSSAPVTPPVGGTPKPLAAPAPATQTVKTEPKPVAKSPSVAETFGEMAKKPPQR